MGLVPRHDPSAGSTNPKRCRHPFGVWPPHSTQAQPPPLPHRGPQIAAIPERSHRIPTKTAGANTNPSGIYNNRNYIRFGLLDPEARTFGHLFKEAGYKTAIAGKW
jgi:arylsulfatase A